MKKIIFGALICSALFLTGCSKDDSTFFKFPTHYSYSFNLKDSGEISSVNLKQYDENNTGFVREENDISIKKTTESSNVATIPNPVRTITENGRTIIDENASPLSTVGFTMRSYRFCDDEYKYIYELDCRANSEAQKDKIDNVYIFSKKPIDIFTNAKNADILKKDSKDHIYIRNDGKIFITTTEKENFIVLNKKTGEDMSEATEFVKFDPLTDADKNLTETSLLNFIRF